MLVDKRIVLVVGHYGSGKTEFALNYAIKLLEKNKKIAIVDLDIVNPYFRSREKKEFIEKNGIRLISNNFDYDIAVDLPSVSASVYAPLQDKDCHVVFDVGGDNVGARVLAQYKKYFKENEYDMYCVINANRPETSNLEGALYHISSIEHETGLKITGIINNTHLIRETKKEDIFRGQILCSEISREINIPLKYVCYVQEILKQFPEISTGQIFPIKLYMRPSWLDK